MAYTNVDDSFDLFKIVYSELKSDRIMQISPVIYAGRSLFE